MANETKERIDGYRAWRFDDVVKYIPKGAQMSRSEIIKIITKFIEEAGGVTSEIVQELIDNSTSSLLEKIEYNSEDKTIIFKNKSGETVFTIDTTDFIKDGMVSNVAIENNNLVITFNTDAGKEPISIPLTDIFDPSNYYTKEDINQKFEEYNENGGGDTNVQANWNETDTNSDAYIKNKPTNVSTFVNDAGYLTQHQDISGKQDVLVSGSNIKTVNNQSLLGSGNITIEGGGVNVQSDWNQTDTTADDYIKNKPTIPNPSNYYTKTEVDGLVQGEANVQADWNVTDTTSDAYIKNKPNLATVATSGSYNDLTDKPTIPNPSNYYTKTEVEGLVEGEANVQADWNQTDTTADDYIKNKPTIPAAQVNSNWNATSGVAQILNKPTIPIIWYGTQDEYNAISPKDNDTVYLIYNN